MSNISVSHCCGRRRIDIDACASKYHLVVHTFLYFIPIYCGRPGDVLLVSFLLFFQRVISEVRRLITTKLFYLLGSEGNLRN